VALFVVFYFLTLMGITVAFHRYFAHNSFKTGRGQLSADR
jgi:stearoyl-CoA desaturase (delta-9 desaturase)